MPNDIITGLVKQSKKSEKEVEKAWNESKAIVADDIGKSEKDFTDKDWGTVTVITKKKIGIKESNEKWIKNFLEAKNKSKEYFGEGRKLSPEFQKAMKSFDTLALASDSLGNKIAMNPEFIWEWAKKHNVDLLMVMPKILKDLTGIVKVISADKPFKESIQKEIFNDPALLSRSIRKKHNLSKDEGAYLYQIMLDSKQKKKALFNKTIDKSEKEMYEKFEKIGLLVIKELSPDKKYPDSVFKITYEFKSIKETVISANLNVPEPLQRKPELDADGNSITIKDDDEIDEGNPGIEDGFDVPMFSTDLVELDKKSK